MSCLTSKFWGFEFYLRPSEVNSGQKYFCCLKAHIIISYLTSIDTFYLEVFLRRSTSKSSIDTFSLFRTVFEILTFKVFRVWPWPSTSKGHLGSKNVIPFESPYMTSYLTSMDTISLYRTVFEIFDFKVFRGWPWPLTSKGHLGSKNFIPFENPYMTSYLTSIDTISLFRSVFEIFDFKVSRGWPWPLTSKGHLGSKPFYTIRKPIYDFLFDFYGHHLSISYRFRDIRLQSF